MKSNSIWLLWIKQVSHKIEYMVEMPNEICYDIHSKMAGKEISKKDVLSTERRRKWEPFLRNLLNSLWSWENENGVVPSQEKAL